MQKVNKHYAQLFNPPPQVRYFVMMGGRGAGRSTTAAQFAAARLRDNTRYFRCAIMRYVLGDIRNSIYQDIHDQLESNEVLDEVTVKENLLTFVCGENKINGIGFKKSSGDQKSKLKSLASYNCVIIEEADEVQEEDFMQLDDSLRTAKSDIVVILMLNPPGKNHWIIKRWFNLVDTEVPGFYRAEKKSTETDMVFISTTYKENLQNLNEGTIRNYERYQEIRPDYYWSTIRGYVSEGARGRIFKNWKPISLEEFRALPYKSFYGLDFGFTNDPTALIEIKMHNERVWFHELLYETGLTNPMISARFETLGLTGEDVIYADSAEPKSIQELSDLGWYVLPAEKGPDSVRAGVNMLLEKEVFYTEISKNLALENQEYKWALDKDKEPTNDPVDDMNHLMDAGRYGVFTRSREAYIGF